MGYSKNILNLLNYCSKPDSVTHDWTTNRADPLIKHFAFDTPNHTTLLINCTALVSFRRQFSRHTTWHWYITLDDQADRVTRLTRVLWFCYFSVKLALAWFINKILKNHYNKRASLFLVWRFKTFRKYCDFNE